MNDQLLYNFALAMQNWNNISDIPVVKNAAIVGTLIESNDVSMAIQRYDVFGATDQVDVFLKQKLI